MASTLTTGNNLPVPQSPFVDPKTGFLSNDGYKYLTGLINDLASAIPTASLAPGLKATGTTQATALQLASQWNVVTVASATANGVLLSAYQAGQSQAVFNQSGVSINIYPPPGQQIDALGANIAYSLGNGKMQIFNFQPSNQIDSTQLG